MIKIVILFSGIGTNLEYILKHMHGRELNVAAAITNNPEAGGIAAAKKFAVPEEILDHRRFAEREMYDRELVQLIRKYSPDLTVLAGFMRILTPVFTENIRALNLHPSLLPRHRGLHAIERSWEDEYPEGGVSVHWVSSELDGGEIVLQKSINKKGHDRDSYSQAVRSMEKELLAEAIRDVLEISQDSCDITP